MSLLNSLAAFFRNWIQRTKAARHHTYDLQVLALELSQCHHLLEQAQQDLKHALDEQTQTERWLCSTKKQVGIRERQVRHALQQGEIQIAKELAEDMVDLEALIEQEEASLRTLANRANVLRRDIQDGILAIATHQAKLDAFNATQTSQNTKTSNTPAAPALDLSDIKESLHFLKRIHLALKLDLQPDHKNAENQGHDTHFRASIKQSKTKHINAVLMRVKASLEMEG